jgi:hypothetical protein
MVLKTSDGYYMLQYGQYGYIQYNNMFYNNVCTYVYGGMNYWRENIFSPSTRPPQLIYSLREKKKHQ